MLKDNVTSTRSLVALSFKQSPIDSVDAPNLSSSARFSPVWVFSFGTMLIALMFILSRGNIRIQEPKFRFNSLPYYCHRVVKIVG